MFGLGGMEIAAALIIALIVFGPKRLPEIGKTLGKGMRAFKVDLSGSGGSKSAQKKDPPKAS
jgi:sec-independent protein translocase protein TatA